MNGFFRLTIVCLKRAIFNVRFLSMVILLALCELLNVLPRIIDSAYWLNGRLYFGTTIIDLLFAEGATLMFCCTLIIPLVPYSCSLCDDVKNGMITSIVIKSGRYRYAIATALAVAISGFVCVFLGETLFMSVCSIFVDICRPERLQNYTFVSLMEGKPLLFLFFKIMLKALRGSFFALIALLISVYVKNRYLILALPVLIYYFLSYFGYFYLKLPVYFDVVAIFFAYVFEPRSISEGYSILYAFACTLLTGFLTAALVAKGVKKCY
ncbi:MAG: hypothetical protein E7266_10005 [Lachnospiraceae bacterium]|nr:hypothetical protein [Lachnospiraceae bacterium]